MNHPPKPMVLRFHQPRFQSASATTGHFSKCSNSDRKSLESWKIVISMNHPGMCWLVIFQGPKIRGHWAASENHGKPYDLENWADQLKGKTDAKPWSFLSNLRGLHVLLPVLPVLVLARNQQFWWPTTKRHGKIPDSSFYHHSTILIVLVKTPKCSGCKNI